jgi:uncharacterized protein
MKNTYTCPTCNKETILNSNNRFRPFCSERCRLIDLGEWIEVSYKISEPTIIDDNNDSDYFIKH